MNCQNCKNWAFGRCTVTNLLVGPDVLCNAWELSQSWEMVDMQFATFDAEELQKRIAELEAERDGYRALCKELESRLDFYYAKTNNVIAKENENLKDKIAELERDLSNKEIAYTDLWGDALALQDRIAELEATVKGHDPFEEYPPKQRGFECSVVVLGKFEYEDEFTPITNWDLCVYWFDEERWHPLNGYVAGDDIVRWYALPSEAQE